MGDSSPCQPGTLYRVPASYAALAPGHVPSSGVKASASSSLMAVSNGNGETLGDHLLWLG
jgi:hypothetical protein